MWFREIDFRDVCLAGTAANITRFDIVGTTVLEIIGWRRTHIELCNWTAMKKPEVMFLATDDSKDWRKRKSNR